MARTRSAFAAASLGIALAAGLVVGAAPASAQHDHHAPSATAAAAPAASAATSTSAARAAFERLKGLAGHWTGVMAGQPYSLDYRVASGGSVVMASWSPTPTTRVTFSTCRRRLMANHTARRTSRTWARPRHPTERSALRVLAGDTMPPDPHIHEGSSASARRQLHEEWASPRQEGLHQFFDLTLSAPRPMPAVFVDRSIVDFGVACPVVDDLRSHRFSTVVAVGADLDRRDRERPLGSWTASSSPRNRCEKSPLTCARFGRRAVPLPPGHDELYPRSLAPPIWGRKARIPPLLVSVGTCTTCGWSPVASPVAELRSLGYHRHHQLRPLLEHSTTRPSKLRDTLHNQAVLLGSIPGLSSPRHWQDPNLSCGNESTPTCALGRSSGDHPGVSVLATWVFGVSVASSRTPALHVCVMG